MENKVSFTLICPSDIMDEISSQIETRYLNSLLFKVIEQARHHARIAGGLLIDNAKSDTLLEVQARNINEVTDDELNEALEAEQDLLIAESAEEIAEQCEEAGEVDSEDETSDDEADEKAMAENNDLYEELVVKCTAFFNNFIAAMKKEENADNFSALSTIQLNDYKNFKWGYDPSSGSLSVILSN